MYILHLSQVLETVFSNFFPRVILVKSNHVFKCVREEKEMCMSNDDPLLMIFCLCRKYGIKTALL